MREHRLCVEWLSNWECESFHQKLLWCAGCVCGSNDSPLLMLGLPNPACLTPYISQLHTEEAFKLPVNFCLFGDQDTILEPKLLDVFIWVGGLLTSACCLWLGLMRNSVWVNNWCDEWDAYTQAERQSKEDQLLTGNDVVVYMMSMNTTLTFLPLNALCLSSIYCLPHGVAWWRMQNFILHLYLFIITHMASKKALNVASAYIMSYVRGNKLKQSVMGLPSGASV